MSRPMRTMVCALALLTLGGCAWFRPPRIGQLETWVLTEGEFADELGKRAGVSGILDLTGQIGNMVRLDAQRALSVRHVVPTDREKVYRFSDSPSAVRVLEFGDPDRPDSWTLLEFEQPFAGPARSLPLGGAVNAGQEALIVGYSQRLSEGTGFALVAVQARLLAWPPSLALKQAGSLLVDVGGGANRLGGLSGSPLLTRDGPESEWRWVGVLEAAIETNTQESFIVALELPVDFLRAQAGKRAP